MKIAPTTRLNRFFTLAKRESEKSEHTKARIGAVIVKGNYVVSSGYNMYKTHTTQFKHNRLTNYEPPEPCLHAEIHALIKSGYHDLTGAELFVYRERKKGGLALSRPCRACQDAISKSGIRHVYFTMLDGFGYMKTTT